MKQTAVEWLWKSLIYSGFKDIEYVQGFYYKAKQMEKEQIIEAYDEAKVEGMYLAANSEYKHLQGFEYYNETFKEKKIKDTIVESVIKQFKDRSEVGIAKYKVTLNREDLSTLEWIQHLQEELMDAVCYIERLKQELK